MTNTELEVINIVDKLIHAITRRHIPDYPEANDAVQALNQLIAEQVKLARLDELQRMPRSIAFDLYWRDRYQALQSQGDKK